MPAGMTVKLARCFCGDDMSVDGFLWQSSSLVWFQRETDRQSCRERQDVPSGTPLHRITPSGLGYRRRWQVSWLAGLGNVHLPGFRQWHSHTALRSQLRGQPWIGIPRGDACHVPFSAAAVAGSQHHRGQGRMPCRRGQPIPLPPAVPSAQKPWIVGVSERSCGHCRLPCRAPTSPACPGRIGCACISPVPRSAGRNSSLRRPAWP